MKHGSGAVKSVMILSFAIVLLALPARAQDGSISGRVTDESGVGIANILVTVYGMAGDPVRERLTDAEGDYHLPLLLPGSYKIHFFNCLSSLNYLSEWYDDKASFEDANPVYVSPDGSVTGINARLAAGGQFSGRVTSASGTGIANIKVHAYGPSRQDLGEAVTDSAGYYLFGGLPAGSYKVQFFNKALNYIAEWFNGKDSFVGADPVAVTVGNVTPGISAQLAKGGQISGKVTDLSGLAMPGIRVRAYNQSQQVSEVTSDEAGNYLMAGLPTDTYKVQFFNNEMNYLFKWYNDKETFSTADPIEVAAGGIVTGIDARLGPGGKLSGRVTDESGTGIADVTVYVRDVNSNWLCSGLTDENGDYTVPALPAGSAKVWFTDNVHKRFAAEWHSDKKSFAAADPITIGENGVITGIDARLAASGRISGRVTDASGNPIRYVMAYIYDLDNLNESFSGVTDANGDYSVTCLPAGSFKVFFRLSQNSMMEWYNDKPSQTAADTLTLAAGGAIAGVDAQLGTAAITVSSPNGGERWNAGSSRLITWTSDGTLASVMIEYSYDQGNHWSTVAVSTENDGSYEWTVPDTTYPSCLVRISDVSGFPGDNSDGYFAIWSDQHTISGTVTNNGSPMAGVVINGLPGTPVTDGSGFYSARVNDGWSGSITPTLPCYKFYPINLSVYGVTQDRVLNFTACLVQALIVENPNGASIWEKGRTHAITWLWQGAQNANVKILLYKKPSTLVGTIAATTPHDGAYNWLVPTTLAAGSAYFVRVKTVDNVYYDDSDTFSIIAPAITVTSPAVGAVWARDTTKTIAWTKTGTQDANVRIQLFKDTIKKLDIAPSVPNSGSFDWAIPSTLVNGAYTIRVATLDGKVKGSSKSFTIARGMIRVTAPATGAKWFRGMANDIAWATEGEVNANVRIQLYRGTALAATISASTPTADGACHWTIPAAMADGAKYSIKITALDNRVSGKTGCFSIQTGAITIFAPAPATSWRQGGTCLISWIKQGDLIDANVRIQLFKGTTLQSVIAATAPNNGYYWWTIPADQAPAANYWIRITTVDNKVTGQSGFFYIISGCGLTVLAPNGNELLRPAETQTIRWNENPDVLEVKLEFSRDNGGSFTTIADHAPNTGSYDWLVPVNFTRNGIVRISDASGRPWLSDGLLEFSLKFSYSGESDESGAILWFGGSDPKDPGYGFARIEIGPAQIQFGGVTKAIDPLAGNWHELRVRLDLRRDIAEIRLDDRIVFANVALNTTRDYYFEPGLALKTGAGQAMDLLLDDLSINVVRLDDQGADKDRFNVLSDDFDRYDGRANSPKTCWRWLDPADKKSSVELGPDGMAGKALRLRTESSKQMLIFLPFSLPDKVPFDISDKCFDIEN